MGQKHPISVITDGDLAMHKAITIIMPNCNHRLCTWHIEQNILRKLHNSKLAEEFRSFIYDWCSIEEIEVKWDQFLKKNRKCSEYAWLQQMYQMRQLWCGAYQVGKCFLGLRSNQRSESLNSKLHTHLDSQMPLFDMIQHYDQCLSNLRRNEAKLDASALQSVPFTKLDAANIEKEAARLFTPTIFALVKKKIDAVSNYLLNEVLDNGCDDKTYIIAVKERRERKFNIDFHFIDTSLHSISCSCCSLQRKCIPCAHIFYVLKILHAEKLPKCCVANRWTMSAKCAFPPIRKSSMYDSSEGLEKYRELRNLSHAASFKAAQSDKLYEIMKSNLNEIVNNEEFNGKSNQMRYGPVLPQEIHGGSQNTDKVLDPLRVNSRGAPKKKRIKGFIEKPRSVTCSRCGNKGHNRRSCSRRKKQARDEDVVESTE